MSTSDVITKVLHGNTSPVWTVYIFNIKRQIHRYNHDQHETD